MPNELFMVGDCVVSTVSPTMIGRIVKIIGKSEKTDLIVRVSGKDVLASSLYWKKVE